MKEGKTEVNAFTERLAEIITNPFRVGNDQLPVKPMASTSKAIASSTPENEESMPF